MATSKKTATKSKPATSPAKSEAERATSKETRKRAAGRRSITGIVSIQEIDPGYYKLKQLKGRG